MTAQRRPSTGHRCARLAVAAAVVLYGIVGFPTPDDPEPPAAKAHPLPGIPHLHGGNKCTDLFCPPPTDGTEDPPQTPGDTPSGPGNNPGNPPPPDNDECGINSNPDGHGGCTAPLYGRPDRCTGDTKYDSVSRLCVSTNPDSDPDFGDRTICPDPRDWWHNGGCVRKERDDDPDRSRHCPAGQVFYSTLGCRPPCDAGQILVSGSCHTVSKPAPQPTTGNNPNNPPAPTPVCPIGYRGTPPDCEKSTPQLFVLGTTASEGDGTVDVTVALSHRGTADATVDVSTSDGTAIAGEDYTAITGQSVTITSGQQTATVTVTIIDDTDEEEAETFTVTASNAVGGAELGADPSGEVTIEESDIPRAARNLRATCRSTGSTFAVDVRFGKPPPPDVYWYAIRLYGPSGWFNTLVYDAPDNDPPRYAPYTFGGLSRPGLHHLRVRPTTQSLAHDGDSRDLSVWCPTQTMAFDKDAVTVAEGGAVDVKLLVNPSRRPLHNIPLIATPQGSTVASDFSFPTSVGTLTIAEGRNGKSLTFTANHDADTDDETVVLSFGSIQGVIPGTPDTVTVTITDDDCAAGEHLHSSDPAATGPYCHSDDHTPQPMCDANLDQTWREHVAGGHVDRTVAACPPPAQSPSTRLTAPAGQRITLTVSVAASASSPRTFSVSTDNDGCHNQDPVPDDCAAPAVHYHATLQAEDEDCTDAPDGTNDATTLTFTSNTAQTIRLCTFAVSDHGTTDRTLKIVLQDTHALRGHVSTTHTVTIEPPMRGVM